MVDPRFKRGARPTPKAKLMSAPAFRATAPPSEFARVPKRLDPWGNFDHGCCVTSEEAFAKGCNEPTVFVPAATVIAWARRYGYLEGADLLSVMQSMQRKGFADGAQLYNDGVPQRVDYTDEGTLQSAIVAGPVKIAIDAEALPHAAGNEQGWWDTEAGEFSHTDHCVSLSGFGPAGWLYSKLGVALPHGLAADQRGYLLYTWATLGFVSHAWLQGTCVEAWVRVPTTVGVPPLPDPAPTPVPPTPTPTPTPTPLPSGVLAVQLSGRVGVDLTGMPTSAGGPLLTGLPPFPADELLQLVLGWLLQWNTLRQSERRVEGMDGEAKPKA